MQVISAVHTKRRDDSGKTGSRICAALALTFILLALPVILVARETDWPKITVSRDGTPISYESYGVGLPALVLVHGWNCDARYWREQIASFAERHRVIALDLAGHGHSGSSRKTYSMKSFGEDVHAVMEAEGIGEAILIGHSMGGSVIVEAARLVPGRVLGLIGVDTLENIEYPLTEVELDAMVAPLEQDFVPGVRQFVSQMLSVQTDEPLREWILSDMAAAPSVVALSAIREMMTQYITGETARLFDDVRLPVVTVNGDLWPIDYEANRRHMQSFEAIVIEGADHFLMMNRPEAFNSALEEAIGILLDRTAEESSAPVDKAQ
ncbi:alpha/beta fold hydrolase [Desulfofustis glycolicus]|uniref:Pimeloyl-ACP methyl ester carboxylesterase n=1 Tax=Desulfofustis glycolicus DSM 9705 TaxID=1121409 RepID=A0A1M5XTN7_9BACT|nr:alpha/beta hydrolase [Desulfofustis glycolicus]MCB2217818.1 alpha/beta hydrolase [Desulfobulbaceae bacterium]SHI02613.1 Pimeloyl-ACP methyl ester carboxylesterase [Desulfofustis glycolicus DSM 9705]